MLWLVHLVLAAPLADMVATSDCAAVLAAVPLSQEDADAQLAAAWCAVRLDRPEEALDRLGQRSYGVLEPYAAWQRGAALLQLDRRSKARDVLAGATVPGPLADDVRWLRAEAAADPAARIEALQKLFAGPAGARARLAAAEAHEALGQSEPAIALLRDVWTDASPGGHDGVAEARLQALGVPAAPLGPSGDALRARRAASLRKAHRHDEALVLYEAIWGPAPKTEADRLALADARSRARDHAGAIALWTEAYGAPDSAKATAEALFTYALAHARLGDYTTAATVYRRLMDQHPKSSEADFASFKLGYMAWDEGKVDDAVAELSAHIDRYPGSAHLDEALWFRARARWSTDRAAAVADLTRLRAERGRSSLAPGAAYWLAVNTLETDIGAGKDALEKVLLSWPTSGYAWFAAARIGRTFPRKPDADPPPLPPALANRDDVKAAQRLVAVGLQAWARAELDDVKGSGTGAVPLAWLRLAAGDYKGAKRLACPVAPKPWQDGNAAAQQACVPRPERRLVEAVAARHGLDPSIPFGVMVAESALDPEVTSPAGARGLMQLMPEVAARLHPSLFPNRPFDADDLYSGAYNAALGTAELGQRTESLAGLLETTSVPAVVASYNGGEEAVRRWAEPYDAPPPFDAWSESIGYTETRHYVKRVLGYAMAVRWVYGDAP